MARVPFEAKREYKLRLAIAWLLAELQDGQPKEAADLLRRAELAGHAQRTMQRASVSLGVNKNPRFGSDGKISGWLWTPTGAKHHRKRSAREAFTLPPGAS